MNAKEKQLTKLLKEMKISLGVLGTKAEFEAEGTRFSELLRLKDLSVKADVKVSLKVGGPEDIWGILQARQIGVDEIVAPMVENAYSLSKFLDAIKKHVPEDEKEDVVIAVNVETINAFNDIDNILKIGKENGLESVTVGRVDLVGSMGLGRKDINSDRIFEITKSICQKAKAVGMRTVIGGGIEKASYFFIEKLFSHNLLDRFETRKIIFNANVAIYAFDEAVLTAHRFELLWLENKQNFYNSILAEDASRIPMLKKRVEGE